MCGLAGASPELEASCPPLTSACSALGCTPHETVPLAGLGSSTEKRPSPRLPIILPWGLLGLPQHTSCFSEPAVPSDSRPGPLPVPLSAGS